MIEYKNGNILQANTDALINTINCVGVMGRGIALQFKQAFPDNFKSYLKACKNNEVQLGKMFVYQNSTLSKTRFIINFPTKKHWRDKSCINDIESGLKDLVNIIQKYHIKSIAIPPLGSGLGGLDWKKVKPIIEKSLQHLPNVHITIYEPTDIHIYSNQSKTNMTIGRAVLVKLMHCYLQGLLDPFITLLEVHKLMYFMQEAGEPLKLNFKPALYGPYAENLRHVLKAINGSLISGYADGGDSPAKQIQLMPNAINDATHFLEQHPEAYLRFDKVVTLVDGFESSFGLELLATVHWVVKHFVVRSIEDVIKHTYAWNKRKQQFSQRQIVIAIDTLSSKGWIDNSMLCLAT